MASESSTREEGLRFGPVPTNACHLCVDMQRLFAEPTEWATPWMTRVLPNVVRMTECHAERTIFTRFIPAQAPGQGPGTWKRYYERWASMTLKTVPPALVQLVPELARFAPPATVVDKRVYSPWLSTDLHARLRRSRVDTLVVTGAETDVCVLATVLGAVDFGYRVIVATDALCSSSDATHDALMTLYHRRFGQQIETAVTDEVLEAWLLT
jgi:nicotinamidase-related amidase